ncbi:MAG: glutamate--tRNA ligase [Cytophagales bacterium]|nr:glutamate--tRNA ligase [Cytophagales bacterium]
MDKSPNHQITKSPNKNVRVRFAPSPTGPLHIGGLRTALYNYLFAKKMGGKMILRIEDTDQSRYVEGAEEYIHEALEWCGIRLDEGPKQGGKFAPYRQSERKSMYMEYAQNLVDNGFAYYAFDTPEELEAMRQRLHAAKVASPQYNTITRNTMKNSITLPEDEVKTRIANQPYVIRLKVPRKEEIRFNDLVRGWVLVHSSAIDDKVLMKSDGMPTYHLANVVDDHLMKITHVIRGEEWLPSTPLHVLLYKYLGWENTMPEFVHLPLLLRPDGNGKLSKRDAEKYGFPIYPIEWKSPKNSKPEKGFRESGYLPEAVINFLAFLGWNPGTQQELFTLKELIKAFSIERIGKSGAKFDIEKAKWYNQQYLRSNPDKELAQYLLEAINSQSPAKGGAKPIECTPTKAATIVSIMKERVTFPNDFWKEAEYFFIAPSSYDQQIANKKWPSKIVDVIADYKEALASIDNFNAETAKRTLTEIIEKHKSKTCSDPEYSGEESNPKSQIKMGLVMQALRFVITGKDAGPDLMSIIQVIGNKETISRIDYALKVRE